MVKVGDNILTTSDVLLEVVHNVILTAFLKLRDRHVNKDLDIEIVGLHLVFGRRNVKIGNEW